MRAVKIESDVNLDYISIYPRALDDDVCDALCAILDAAVTSGAAGRIDHDYRRCTMLGFHSGSALFDEVRSAIHTSIQAYISEEGEAGRILNFCHLLEEPNLIRYVPGGGDQFHEHADAWSIESVTRQLSVIVYLNDVAEGGETVFTRHGIHVKPNRGTILLFPSAFTHMHRGDPPISGQKDVIVTWLHMGTSQQDVRFNVSPLHA